MWKLKKAASNPPDTTTSAETVIMDLSSQTDMKMDGVEYQRLFSKNSHYFWISELRAFTGTTGIGRKPPEEADAKGQKVHWVTLQGLGLADQHALLIRHGKTGAEVELRVAPGASKMTKVNGVPLKESTTLQNRDRILFGSYQLYVFHNPLDKASKILSPKDSQDVIDWEFAQRELALATGIDGLDYKPKSREDLILQKELLELIPMVTEVNAISEELNKQRAFDILLIPPTAQGLLYGEPRTTK
ncbi:uncharacterized protein DEA37_0007821 [Paragonimus westermani]|uniref:FHA domain-containing protein n=1 Tax=Paragonimus westermani TaxID=34504 RepID=A0A5J4NB91_9TREM|nr:uncharacterized protein DEA37_0007821 [Paragonimus westermani]